MDSQTVKSIDYHRNGCHCGGFYVAVVEEDAEDEDGRPERYEMLVVYFPQEEITTEELQNDDSIPYCLAFDLKYLDNRNIAFGSSSYRGDRYIRVMEEAIEDLESGQRRRACDEMEVDSSRFL